jgi:MFS family permease
MSCTVDTNAIGYINNWYAEMDLVCQEEGQVALLLSMYFLGFVFGGVFGFLSDKYGRRLSLITLFSVHLVALTVLLFSTSYSHRIVAFFFMGLA